MLTTHEEFAGRMALAAAVALEALVWFARPLSFYRRPKSASSNAVATASPLTAPAYQSSPAPDVRPSSSEASSPVDQPNDDFYVAVNDLRDPPIIEWATVSHVLLRRHYDVVPSVFYASLRRSGQRDATLIDASPADEAIRVQVDSILLELRSVTGACELPVLQASSTEGRAHADIAEDVLHHDAHVTLTSVYQTDIRPDQVVRLHHRVHAALAEFAPVVAILWPAAGRIVPSDHLPELLAQASEPDQPMLRTCTDFRVSSFEEADSQMVSESVGLFAFGLPDVQIVTPGEPGELVTVALHQIAERFFVSGCDLANGSDVSLGDGNAWQIRHARSALPPDRQVVQIVMKRGQGVEGARGQGI